MAVAAELPSEQTGLGLVVDVERQDSNAMHVAKVALGSVELGLLVSSRFLDPKITIPAAVGVAVFGAVMEQPPDWNEFGGHISRRDVRAIADSALTYSHDIVIRSIKGNIPEATHSLVDLFSSGAKVAIRSVIYHGAAAETR